MSGLVSFVDAQYVETTSQRCKYCGLPYLKSGARKQTNKPNEKRKAKETNEGKGYEVSRRKLFVYKDTRTCMSSSSKGFVVFEFTHKVSMPNNKEEGKNVVHDLLLVMAFIRFGGS